jgi:hypothetical protein
VQIFSELFEKVVDLYYKGVAQVSGYRVMMSVDILRARMHLPDRCSVTEALVPLDKRDLFKEGAIALEALSETTNGDADSVVMNSACQSPKFFEAQPTADSADEKSGLACTGAANR